MLSFVPLVPPANPETVSRRESILPQFYPTSFGLLFLLVCDVYSTALNLSYKHSQPDKYKKATPLGSLNLKAFEKLEQLRKRRCRRFHREDPDLNSSRSKLPNKILKYKTRRIFQSFDVHSPRTWSVHRGDSTRGREVR